MRKLLILAALVASPLAAANEAAIRQTVEAKFSGVKVEGVSPAPVAGLYEVRVRLPDGSPQVLYADAQAHHLFLGSLIDTRSDRNLTEERMRRLTAIDMAALPYELAVRVQRGNGRRTLVVFTDPYCPACQELEKTLIRIDDITIHYFMYPVIRPELADHSRAVWCAPDRAKAWLDLALRAKPPANGANCENPVDRVIDLGRRLGVGSTPTLFLASGERIRGGPRREQLLRMLDEALPPAKKK